MGLDLGQGWTTPIASAGYYAVLFSAFLLASPILGAILLASFGLGRALPVIIAGLTVADHDIMDRSLWYLRHRSGLRLFTAALLALIGGYLLFTRLPSGPIGGW